uniref:Uncharacterized protein n=1 Tax=Glossina pallidipes TaxID=7398 RepID=A0A1A9Z429_GLOPL
MERRPYFPLFRPPTTPIKMYKNFKKQQQQQKQCPQSSQRNSNDGKQWLWRARNCKKLTGSPRTYEYEVNANFRNSVNQNVGTTCVSFQTSNTCLHKRTSSSLQNFSSYG